MTGPAGSLPMGVRPVDDKSSDTLVAGPRRRVLDGEFDSPPSPPRFRCAGPGYVTPVDRSPGLDSGHVPHAPGLAPDGRGDVRSGSGGRRARSRSHPRGVPDEPRTLDPGAPTVADPAREPGRVPWARPLAARPRTAVRGRRRAGGARTAHRAQPRRRPVPARPHRPGAAAGRRARRVLARGLRRRGVRAVPRRARPAARPTAPAATCSTRSRAPTWAGTGTASILDFNFAYNPSCAYDPRWSCPLAPPANWLQVPIRAGERYTTHE